MWLGFSAAFIGMLYALVKFFTAYRLRQQRERILVTRHEVEHAQQRIDLLEEKLHIEQSKQRTLQREVEALEKKANQLYARLHAVLPQAMLPQLERCQALLVEEDEVQDYKLFEELNLLERVGEALDLLSLLVVHFPDIEEEQLAIALGQLKRQLEEQQVSHHGPIDGEMVCYFARPLDALTLWRQMHAALPEHSPSLPRAILYAGVELSPERSELRRLFARSLQKARNALDEAPSAALLLNGEAYDALTKQERQGIEECDAVARLYLLNASQARVQVPATHSKKKKGRKAKEEGGDA